MEKSGTGTRTFCAGLLALIIFAALARSALAQSALAQNSASTLQFKKMQEYFFTSAECSFELMAPDVEPDRIQLGMGSLTQGVSLVSLRKEAVPGVTATKITAVFKCTWAGRLQIPPVKATVRGRSLMVYFEDAEVYENPRLIKPELSVDIAENSIHIGDHIVFTVSIKYAVQVLDVNWELPQDSIFKELKRYEITQSVTRGAEFSTQLAPVATFDWQPLSQGIFALPAITVTATSYSGTRVEAGLEEQFITVTPRPPSAYGEEETFYESTFAYAFTRPAQKEKLHTSGGPTVQAVAELARLRTMEKHSLPLSSYASLRKQQEKELGLSPGPNEPSIPLAVLIAVLAAILVAATIILLVFRKKAAGIACLTGAVLFFVLAVTYGAFAMRKTALFAGGTVNAVPEEHYSSSVPLEAASRVYVQKQAGSWIYIRYEETYGWVKGESLFYID